MVNKFSSKLLRVFLMIINVIAKTIKLIEASGSVFLLEVTAMFSEPKVTYSVTRGSAAHTTCKFKTTCGLSCFNNIETNFSASLTFLLSSFLSL